MTARTLLERLLEVPVRGLELLVLLPILLSAGPAPSLAARMHDSWADATLARDRLVAGDLAGVRAAGARLSAVGPDLEVPAAWRSGADGVRAIAGELAAVADLPSAAVTVGKLGLACANCHAAAGAGPDLDSGAALPPQTFLPGDNMRLHAWASQWLWLGLIGGSDSAWNRGAAALDDHPLDLRWDEKPPSDGRQALEQLVYVIAGKAVDTSVPAERAELYGQLVATCAQCHIKTPPAPSAPSGPQ